MTGQLMLEVSAAAEELPVGVLDPLLDDRLIRLIEEVLQIMQADHQPHRQAGAVDLLGVGRAELHLEAGPVDSLGQLIERVLMREERGEPHAVRVI
jgi:hypothetical protein